MDLNGVPLLQGELECNLGVVLDMWFLFTKAVARKTFVIQLVYQFCLDQEVQLMVRHALVPSHLSYCHIFYIGLALKSIWKPQLA